MGLFSKKNKTDESPTDAQGQDVQSEPKKKSDKSIKPRAPKSLGPKKFIRFVFWVFVGFLLMKGIVSFAQGTRVIENITTIGSDTPAISDSVKGFATDFAMEYFTWNINNVNDRIARLEKFIGGIEQDAGLKSYDLKGTSRVLSVEVYNTEKIDENHYDITVVVRREIEIAPAPGETASSTPASSQQNNPIVMKTYMVVPVTVTAKGPLVQSYPRFVSEQQKGETERYNVGQSITDITMLQRGSELAESFLRSYFEGNLTSLKYFYADTASVPSSLTKSAYTIEKVNKVDIYQIGGEEGTPSYLRIEAAVIVKNDIGESFTNLWIINATNKDDRLYVLSIGQPEAPDVGSTQNSPDTANNEEGQSSPAPASSTSKE